MAYDVGEREVLEVVGADRLLGGLRLLAVLGRDQLGCDLLLQDLGQHLVRRLRELAVADHPADEVLHERLGHPGVDGVVRHLVTDAVGAPAQRELGEVAGADDDAPALVGETEEVVVAQAGLDVLEGDVVDLVTVGVGVTHVRQHLLGRRADVELLEGDAERPGESGGVALRRRPGGEAGHGEGEHVAARAAEAVHRLARHDQGVRGVEAAADADHGLGTLSTRRGDRGQPLLESGDLDVVGLVAVELEPRGVVGHEREAVDLAQQADVAVGRLQLPVHGAEARRTFVVGAAVVVEGPLAQTLLAQPVEVDVGDRAARPVGEALALLEQVAALVYQRLAVPAQVGGRLALACGRIDVRRRAARARTADQQPSVLRARHGDRASRQVGKDGGTRQRGLGTRRDRHPHVLADLDVEVEAGDVEAAEDEVRAEAHVLAGDRDPLQLAVVAGGEPAALVELAVVGQVGLRRDPHDRPALDDDRTVVDPVALHQRGAHDEHGHQVGARGDDLRDRLLDRGEERVLEEQVVDGVARQPELGEDRHGHTVVVQGVRLLDHLRGVGRRVGQVHRHRAGGDAGEALGVGRVEVHALTLGSRRS